MSAPRALIALRPLALRALDRAILLADEGEAEPLWLAGPGAGRVIAAHAWSPGDDAVTWRLALLWLVHGDVTAARLLQDRVPRDPARWLEAMPGREAERLVRALAGPVAATSPDLDPDPRAARALLRAAFVVLCRAVAGGEFEHGPPAWPAVSADRIRVALDVADLACMLRDLARVATAAMRSPNHRGATGALLRPDGAQEVWTWIGWSQALVAAHAPGLGSRRGSGRTDSVPCRPWRAIRLHRCGRGLWLTRRGLPSVLLRCEGYRWVVEIEGLPSSSFPLAEGSDLVVARVAALWHREWLASGRWSADLRPPRGRWEAAVHVEVAPIIADVPERDEWVAAIAPLCRPAMSEVEERCADRRATAVWRRLQRAQRIRPSPRTISPLDDARFWSDPHLVDDVLRIDAAAAAVRALMEVQRHGPEPVLVATLFERGWLHLFTRDGARAPRVLRRSFGRHWLDWDAEYGCLLDLGLLDLPRSLRGRLQLLVATRLAEERRQGRTHPCEARFLHLDEAALTEAVAAFRAELDVGDDAAAEEALFGPEHWLGDHEVLDLLIDAPDAVGPVHREGLPDLPVGFPMRRVRAALWWYRFARDRGAAFDVDPGGRIGGTGSSLPADRALAALPVELPERPCPGLRITPLATVGELRAEGLRMRHCVGSLAVGAVKGWSYFLHLELDGELATVRLDRDLRVDEAQGPANTANRATRWARDELPELVRRAPRRVEDPRREGAA